MSELESTDLICEARRRELSERDQRRLEDLISTDLDAKLMLLMQPELERASRVQVGDEVLARRLAEYALQIPQLVTSAPDSAATIKPGNGSSRRARGPIWFLAAAAIFMVGSGAAAWKLVQLNPVELIGSVNDEDTSGVGTRHVASNSRAAKLAISGDAPLTTAPNVSTVPTALVLDSTSSVPAPEEVAPALEPQTGKCRDCGGRPIRASSGAGQLFAQANQLRRDGHAGAALQLYRRILAEHPSSSEAALARVVLAKSLASSKPSQALAHYQDVARVGGPLRAEALWGIVEIATALNQPALKQQALGDLIREFPDSAYADVARRGMTDAAR